MTIVGTSLSCIVGSDGTFTLNGVPAGTITLEFKGNGVDETLSLDGMVSGEVRHISVTITGSGVRLDSDDHGGENQGTETEIQGPISATDPAALTITVNGQVVSVPGGTEIKRGDTPLAFSDLHVGDQVTVKATNTNGNLVAQEVDVENSEQAPGGGGSEQPGEGGGTDQPNEGSEQKVDGPVTGKTGTCPAVSFHIGATLVSANAATTYDGTSCTALGQTSQSVEVKGTLQSDGSLLAREIEVEN